MAEQYQSNIKFLSLSNYTRPEIEENPRLNWIEYGEDNNYFQYIIDRYYGSPTNHAVINSVVDAIYGNGLAATDAKANPEGWAKIVTVLSKHDLKAIIQDWYITGNATAEIKRNDNGEIIKAYHTPVDKWRAEKCNKEGQIKGYYYAYDWSEVRKKEDVKYFKSFEFDKTSKTTLFWIKASSIGTFYYAPCSYQGSLQYSELEEEISNYHINNIKNGLSPSFLINFNNGQPPEEEQTMIEAKVNDKYGGSSNAGRAIIAFNDGSDRAATIDAVQLSDADKQYQFLSDECTHKILRGHRITSPMLVGVKDSTGLGNNAEEIKTATQFYDNYNIQPKQEFIIEYFIKPLFMELGLTFDYYFKTLHPIEFTEVDKEIQSEEDIEKETGVEMCSHKKLSKEQVVIDKFISAELISCGEDEEELLEGFELINTEEVDYDNEEGLDQEIQEANKKYASSKSSLSKVIDFVKMASTGMAFPNAKSEQDKVVEDVQYKVRYEYSPKSANAESRQFCRDMVSASKIYRKEDITRMTDKVVNAGFGEGGSDTYSIWLYKGGPRCGHRWLRKTYIKKGTEGSIDVRNPNAKTVSTSKAEREGYRVRNPKEVSMKPDDMPRKGFSPNNPNLPKDAR